MVLPWNKNTFYGSCFFTGFRFLGEFVPECDCQNFITFPLAAFLTAGGR
jgi:hypothetical protein